MLGKITPNYAIHPNHINTSQRFHHAFGHYETEGSALILVRFAQQRKKKWEPFTLADIDAFYSEAFRFRSQTFNNAPFIFNLLIEPGASGCWIVEDSGVLHFTYDFVARCFKSAPALQVVCPSCGAVEDGSLFYIPLRLRGSPTHRMECMECHNECSLEAAVTAGVGGSE